MQMPSQGKVGRQAGKDFEPKGDEPASLEPEFPKPFIALRAAHFYSSREKVFLRIHPSYVLCPFSLVAHPPSSSVFSSLLQFKLDINLVCLIFHTTFHVAVLLVCRYQGQWFG